VDGIKQAINFRFFVRLPRKSICKFSRKNSSYLFQQFQLSFYAVDKLGWIARIVPFNLSQLKIDLSNVTVIEDIYFFNF